MANNRADRFFQSPVKRDEEWLEATKPPGWEIVALIAVVSAAIIVGFITDYASLRLVAGVVVIVALLAHLGLARRRRNRARRELREAHAEAMRAMQTAA